MNKALTIGIVTGFFTLNSISASPFEQKVLPATASLFSGFCTIKSVNSGVSEKKATKTFNLKIAESGEYFVTAWMCARKGQSFEVQITGEHQKCIGKLTADNNGWQSIILADSSLGGAIAQHFASGSYTAVVFGEMPEVPNVDLIRFSNRFEDAAVPEHGYEEFIYALTQKEATLFDTGIVNGDMLWRHESVLDDSGALQSGEILAYTQGAPAYAYSGAAGLSFDYTYYTSFYFTQTTVVTFETTNRSSGCNPVMYLFKVDGLPAHSWADDNGAPPYNAKLQVTIPATGTYCLMVAAYSPSSSGIADLKKDGSTHQTGIPVAGRKFGNRNYTQNINYNFFTANISGDTWLWVANYNDNKILAYNDDYNGAGDFNWGLQSRVKQ